MQSTNISQEDTEISPDIDDATRVRNLTVFQKIIWVNVVHPNCRPSVDLLRVEDTVAVVAVEATEREAEEVPLVTE